LGGAVPVAAGYFLPRVGSNFTDLLVRSVVITVVYTVQLLLFKPSADLEQFTRNLIARARGAGEA